MVGKLNQCCTRLGQFGPSVQYTLFQNNLHFSMPLFACKLALVALFKAKGWLYTYGTSISISAIRRRINLLLISVVKTLINNKLTKDANYQNTIKPAYVSCTYACVVRGNHP